jgi:hypothetical protein
MNTINTICNFVVGMFSVSAKNQSKQDNKNISKLLKLYYNTSDNKYRTKIKTILDNVYKIEIYKHLDAINNRLGKYIEFWGITQSEAGVFSNDFTNGCLILSEPKNNDYKFEFDDNMSVFDLMYIVYNNTNRDNVNEAYKILNDKYNMDIGDCYKYTMEHQDELYTKTSTYMTKNEEYINRVREELKLIPLTNEEKTFIDNLMPIHEIVINELSNREINTTEIYVNVDSDEESRPLLRRRQVN